MLIYASEITFRIWEGSGGKVKKDLPGHAAATIRRVANPNTVVSTHISWFPAGTDLNQHAKGANKSIKFQTRTAKPTVSNYADEIWEAGGASIRYNSQSGYDLAKRLGEELLADIESEDDISNKLTLINDARAHLVHLQEQNTENRNPDYWMGVAQYLFPFIGKLEEHLNDPSVNITTDFPPIEKEHKFSFEMMKAKHQKIRDHTVLTVPYLKMNIPDLYSQVYIRRVARGTITTKPIDQAILNRIHDHIPNNGYAYWGLNLNAITEAWEAYLKNPANGYKYTSKTHNCAGVVTQMMLKGGAEAYSKLKSISFWRDPEDVRVDVENLAEALLTLNQATWRFRTDMMASQLYMRVGLVDCPYSMVNDLWSVEEFKANSKSPNTMSLRRDQVAKIDAILADYHRAGRWSHKETFTKKLTALVKMFKYILDHREKKPTSDRRIGVDSLGVQILKVLEGGIPRMMYDPLDVGINKANTALNQRAGVAQQVKK